MNYKPCPFCKCEKIIECESDPKWVICENCGIMVLKTEWNNRPLEDELKCCGNCNWASRTYSDVLKCCGINKEYKQVHRWQKACDNWKLAEIEERVE